MAHRRKSSGRPNRERPQKHTASTVASNAQIGTGVAAFGWTILAHPLFLDQVERLVAATQAEASGPTGHAGANAKLLAHLLDLAFDKIPRDPGNAAFRQGGTLGDDRKHWFRGKTGNGRYRLFYRFQSAARIIVYAWVNDENSLRTYGSSTDAYAVFARMLNAGNPPDSFDSLVAAASSVSAIDRLGAVAKRRRRSPR
jgi:toxin YhaV